MAGEEFEHRKAMLEPETEEHFVTFLMSVFDLFGRAKSNDKYAEFFYELEESKKHFPGAWAEAEGIFTKLGLK